MPLVAAYGFSSIGGSTVADLSGNGHDINLTGQPAAQVDSAGVLDGGALGKTGADTIPLPSSLLAATETDDRSVMVDVLGQRSVWWVRSESGPSHLNTGVFGLLSLNSTQIMTRARDQAGGAPTPSSANIGALSNTVPHNVCITYKRSTGVLTYYYDGAAVGTQAFTAGTALHVGADELNIAEWSDTTPAMDNLRFFDHELSGAEVTALAGTPVVAPVLEAAGSLPILLGLDAAATVPPATIPEATGTLPLAVGLSGAATVPPATVPTATAALPVVVELGGTATVPVPGVPQASSSVHIALTLVGAATVPTPDVPAATASLPLVVTLAGHAAGPPASVPQATATLPVLIGLHGSASDGEQHDITLTATLATQPRATVHIGAQRWTATLGAQP